LKKDSGNRPATHSDVEFRMLRNFFAGYLHEDFNEEYGSAAGAVAAFCNDANREEVEQTREEWVKLRKRLASRPIEEMREALRKLGCAWRPQDESEMIATDAAFATEK